MHILLTGSHHAGPAAVVEADGFRLLLERDQVAYVVPCCGEPTLEEDIGFRNLHCGKCRRKLQVDWKGGLAQRWLSLHPRTVRGWLEAGGMSSLEAILEWPAFVDELVPMAEQFDSTAAFVLRRRLSSPEWQEAE